MTENPIIKVVWVEGTPTYIKALFWAAAGSLLTAWAFSAFLILAAAMKWVIE